MGGKLAAQVVALGSDLSNLCCSYSVYNMLVFEHFAILSENTEISFVIYFNILLCDLYSDFYFIRDGDL